MAHRPRRTLHRPLVPQPAPLGDQPAATDGPRGGAHPTAHRPLRRGQRGAEPGLPASLQLRRDSRELGIFRPWLRRGDRKRRRRRRADPAGHRSANWIRGTRSTCDEDAAPGRARFRGHDLAAVSFLGRAGVLGGASRAAQRRRGVSARRAHRRLLARMDQPR